jgi:hypothetical protein
MSLNFIGLVELKKLLAIVHFILLRSISIHQVI